MISSDPGEGKTWLALDLAARVSKGTVWPDDSKVGPPGQVFYISIEDKASDTIRPRIDSLGGDPSKITVLNPEFETFLNFADADGLSFLERQIKKLKNLRMIVIDPILDFSGKTNPNAAEQVRGFLAPLIKLAEKNNFALILIAHLNKSQTMSSLYRTGGSTGGWLGKCRAGFMIFRNQNDKSERIFAPLKTNLSISDPDKWAFRIVEGRLLYSIVTEDLDIDDHLNPERRTEFKESNLAVLWLKEKLKNGPVDSKKLHIMASEDGIPKTTLFRTSLKLNVIKKIGGFGENKESIWSLPENE